MLFTTTIISSLCGTILSTKSIFKNKINFNSEKYKIILSLTSYSLNLRTKDVFFESAALFLISPPAAPLLEDGCNILIIIWNKIGIYLVDHNFYIKSKLEVRILY